MASNIVQLLDERIKITSWINSVLYGSIEVRERKYKKYIYVHYRNGKKVITKYAGEYSSRLVNIIMENTLLAKELKKRLNRVNKQLKKLGYMEKELNNSIKSSIKHVSNNLTNVIYNQIKINDLNINYEDVNLLVKEDLINNMLIKDANRIKNLKNAWDFALNKDVINTELSFDLLSQINALIDLDFSYNAGKLRRISLQIENSSYIPSIPFEEDVNSSLFEIQKNKAKALDKALNLFTYLQKTLVFTNSNLETSIIFVNYYLVKNGLGLLYVPYVLKEELNNKLLNLYEWNEEEDLKKFLLENCYFEK
ncbi:MAG: hypothetical protein IJV94_02325 [Bacilli bacterium]|nr:hypothetical protein [Bacilli bacterium]